LAVVPLAVAKPLPVPSATPAAAIAQWSGDLGSAIVAADLAQSRPTSATFDVSVRFAADITLPTVGQSACSGPAAMRRSPHWPV